MNASGALPVHGGPQPGAYAPAAPPQPLLSGETLKRRRRKSAAHFLCAASGAIPRMIFTRERRGEAKSPLCGPSEAYRSPAHLQPRATALILAAPEVGNASLLPVTSEDSNFTASSIHHGFPIGYKIRPKQRGRKIRATIRKSPLGRGARRKRFGSISAKKLMLLPMNLAVATFAYRPLPHSWGR